MEQQIIEITENFVWPEERARLVRYCTKFTNNASFIVVSDYETYRVLRIDGET